VSVSRQLHHAHFVWAFSALIHSISCAIFQPYSPSQRYCSTVWTLIPQQCVLISSFGPFCLLSQALLI